jgi:metal-responsive CopG/Arc/MetJ family transcriptional regulator
MVGSTDRDRTEKLGITLPVSLLKQIENERGDVPRSTFIRRAVENYLKGSKGKR